MSDFLRFVPVRVQARHNGWTIERQLRLIVALARGASVGEAVRTIGMTRQSAYRLRARPDAGSFAAAWDNAIGFAGQASAIQRSDALLASRVETLLVPRYFRGRLIGYVQRDDVAGAMRTLNMLDRMADRLGDVESLRRRAIELLATSDTSDTISL